MGKEKIWRPDPWLKVLARVADSWGMKPKPMWILVFTLLALTACGPSAPVQIEGDYSLAGDDFVEAAVQSLRDSGRLPAGAEGLAKQQLRGISMSLALRPGGEFVSHMKAMGKAHEYKGTWRRAGDQIYLTQTHEDGVEKPDSMEGRIEGGMLRLKHMEEGVPFPYVLQRVENPAAPGK